MSYLGDNVVVRAFGGGGEERWCHQGGLILRIGAIAAAEGVVGLPVNDVDRTSKVLGWCCKP